MVAAVLRAGVVHGLIVQFSDTLQAVMMDALITGFVEDLKQKLASNGADHSTQLFENNVEANGKVTHANNYCSQTVNSNTECHF